MEFKHQSKIATILLRNTMACSTIDTLKCLRRYSSGCSLFVLSFPTAFSIMFQVCMVKLLRSTRWDDAAMELCCLNKESIGNVLKG